VQTIKTDVTMARPSDISSKAIAARVPMTDYIKFLQEAMENNMSMSDLVLTRLYSSASKEELNALKEALNKIEQLTKAAKSSLVSAEINAILLELRAAGFDFKH
jgi:hypothetical protein